MVARSLNRLGNWHLNLAQPLEARHYHEEALAIFQRLQNPRGIAETLDLLALAAGLNGDLVQGVSFHQQAIPLLEALGDRQTLGSALTVLAQTTESYFTDTLPLPGTSFENAVENLGRALAIAREIGSRAGEANALIVLGEALGPRGDFGRALSSLQQGLALAEEIAHREWILGATCGLGLVHRDLLALPIALGYLEQALNLTKTMRSPYWVSCVTGFLASTCIAAEDLHRAEEVLVALPVDDARLQMLGDRLCQSARAELALAQGKPEVSLPILDQLVASVPATSAGKVIPRLWYLRGQMLMMLNRADEAAAALRDAAKAAAALDHRPLLWRIHVTQASLVRARCHSDDAEQAMARARAIIQELATSIPDDTLRTDFLEQAMRLIQQADAI
jgi:tetratricopeptide (TPR) repeat protein